MFGFVAMTTEADEVGKFRGCWQIAVIQLLLHQGIVGKNAWLK